MCSKTAVYALVILTLADVSSAQLNRISYNNQFLFLSGANLAWLNFAQDIGPASTDFDGFASIMLRMHDSGGNVLRWWLHTDGSVTPQFGLNNLVQGPGEDAIGDLRQVLDMAWEHEIGLILCLWSFDMLRKSNTNTVLDRNRLMLSDTTYMNTYISNSLIPMVDSVRNHPALVAWEIFNEPEGMSNEFGWNFTLHVKMSDIQRFINRCAAAIHRTDPGALVTSGAWSFISLSDVTLSKNDKTDGDTQLYSSAEKKDLENRFEQRYKIRLSAEQIITHMQNTALKGNYNYYSNRRLIEAGGDSLGTLDFYSVHYYDWAGKTLSPFHRSARTWLLNKAIVVAEFDMKNTFLIPAKDLFEVLYRLGYAGALPWSWTDDNFSTPEQMLAGMRIMWDKFREDVDIAGISGDWPHTRIIQPENRSIFPEKTEVTIEAWAADADGLITLVEFYISDTLKIGHDTTAPYKISWIALNPGTYDLTAVATDNQNHMRTSDKITIIIGQVPQFFELLQNYPNPFNPITVIPYTLPNKSDVKIVVYDVSGRHVATLVDGIQQSGRYDVEYNASGIASGIYFYRLDVAGDSRVRRMVRIK